MLRGIFLAAITTLLYNVNTEQSYAQCAKLGVEPSTSSGITIGVPGVKVRQSSVTIQFFAQNNTATRVYLIDALYESSHKPVLGSGVQSYSPTAAGIRTSEGYSLSACIQNPVCSGSLDKYSYIEPTETLAFSITSNTEAPPENDDTVSLSVILVARFARSANEITSASRPSVIRFNFSSISLCRQ